MPISSPSNTRRFSGSDASQAVISLPQLAHELNSLLDGSIRSLTQAEKSLNAATGQMTIDAAVARLQLAREGLRDMAGLLERTMNQPEPDVRLFDSSHPLATQVQRIVESLQPLARQHRVELIVQINQAASRLRSGTLGTVILNAMRNGIEACATSRRVPRRVEFSATISTHHELVLLISDNGPGIPEKLLPGQTTKPEGHGIGLVLCRQIVKEIGGRFEIVSVPGNLGTVVRVNIPLARRESA